MYLVEDITINERREIMTNAFGVNFPLFSFSWILLLCLNPKIRRFVYSGIRQDDCEGTSCSSPLVEASVAASRLTSVVF